MRSALALQDSVIEHLAYDLVVKDEQLVAALQDGEAYRLLSQVAVADIARLTAELDSLRDRHHLLLEELRAVRAGHHHDGHVAPEPEPVA